MARRKAITFETATGEERWRLPVLTAGEVASLPPSAELVYAARAIGIGRTRALTDVKDHGALLYGGGPDPRREGGHDVAVPDR